MSRRVDQRLDDILAAAAAIADHLTRGELDDGLVFDAVRVRLSEIGEAVTIDPDLLAREPAIPWIDVAGMGKPPCPPLLRYRPRNRAGHTLRGLTPGRSWKRR